MPWPKRSHSSGRWWLSSGTLSGPTLLQSLSHQADKQHYLNASINKMESTINALPPSAEYSKHLLLESKKDLCTRQKHLRIADYFGWNTVEAYTAGNIGGLAEDDRLMMSAVAAAQRTRPPFSPARQGRGRSRSGNDVLLLPQSAQPHGFSNAASPWQQSSHGRCYLCRDNGIMPEAAQRTPSEE